MKGLTFISSESQIERRKEGGAEKVLEEIMAHNVLDLARDIKLLIQEAEQTSGGINSKKSMLRHITRLLRLKSEKSRKQ